MGLKSFARKFFGMGGGSNLSLWEIIQLSAPVLMNKDTREYATEGYGTNPTVYRCISLIAEEFASVELTASVDGDPVPDHPILELLRDPNPFENGDSLSQNLVSFYLLDGNGYLEVDIRTSDGLPGQLRVVTPYGMTLEREGGKLYYKKRSPNGGTRKWEVDPITGETELMHWRTFNPTDPIFGMAPIEAGRLAVASHNSASRWNVSLIQNNSTPPGSLGSEKSLDSKQIKAIEEQYEKFYTGPKNARRPLILGGGLKWQAHGLSPTDLDYIDGKTNAAEEIASIYGVPGQLVPIRGSQTYANYEQARLALWTDRVLPTLKDYIGAVNKWLAPYYKDGVVVGYDEKSIEALWLMTKDRIESIKNTDGILSINEQRQLLGFEQRDDPAYETVWISAGKLPASFDLLAAMEEGEKGMTAALVKSGYKPENAEKMARLLCSI